MKPYYQDELVTLYHGDCLSVCRDLAPESISVLVTDPPYGISFLSGHYSNGNPFGSMKFDDITNAAWLAFVCGLLRPTGAVYCFSRWDVVGMWKALIEFTGLEVKNCLVWDKTQTGMGDLTGAYAPSHEIILFASRGRHVLRRGRPPDILRAKRIGARRNHPTEKPTNVMAELILNSSDVGDCVLDPFCGVGPTLLAAKLNNRKAIGIEIEERYCEVAADRLRQGSLSDMFASSSKAAEKEQPT